MATPIDVVVLKCRKICQTEISETVRYLPDRKISSLSNSRYCVDRAQILQGQSNIRFTMFLISSK